MRVTDGGRAIDHGTFLCCLRDDASAREAFRAQLASAPFDAVFWETPPIHRSTLSAPFEYALIDAPALVQMAPDPDSFAEHFSDAEGVVDFGNLGGDAHLIAPSPRAALSHYVHLTAFVRGAPRQQVHDVFRRVGQRLLDRDLDEPVWLSSSGLGVGWLHLRLDRRPKYYSHAPYRCWPRRDVADVFSK